MNKSSRINIKMDPKSAPIQKRPDLRISIKSRLYSNVFMNANVSALDAATVSSPMTELSKSKPSLGNDRNSAEQIQSFSNTSMKDTIQTPAATALLKPPEIVTLSSQSEASSIQSIPQLNINLSGSKRADIDFFKSIKSSTTYSFYYLKPAKSHLDPSYDPYELDIVTYESVDPFNYFTVSKEAVLHFFKGNVESFTVDQMIKDMECMTKLKKLAMIRDYPRIKAFSTWLHNVRKSRNSESAAFLKKNLYNLDNILRKALLGVKQQCIDFENNISIISYPIEPVTISSFLTIQSNNITQNISKTIVQFNSAILNIAKICFAAIIERQGAIFEEEVQATGVKQYRYTKQASIRNTARELYRFTKLLDYMVLGTVNWWVIDGINLFIQTVGTCPDDKNLFHIDAIIDKNGLLQSNPNQKTILESVEEIFQKIPLFLKQFSYLSNISSKLINIDLLDDAPINENINLGDILNNINWKNNIHTAQEVFQLQLNEVQKYLESLKEFQDIYSYNCKADLNWVNLPATASLNDIESWLTSCEENLIKFQKELKAIGEIPDFWAIKSFKIDLQPMKVAILPLSVKNLDIVRTTFPIALNLICKYQLQELSVLINSLQKTPALINDYVARLSNLDNAQTLTDKFERSSGLIEQGINLAKSNGCNLADELNAGSQMFSNSLFQLKDAIDLAYQSRDHICHQFAVDLDKAIQTLQSQAIGCRDEAMNPKIFNLNSNPNENLSFLERLSTSINDLSNLSDQYESYIKQFDLNTTKKASIEAIKLDIETKKELWNIFIAWKAQDKQWRQQSYSSIDINNLKQMLDEFLGRLKKVSEILPSNDVVFELQNTMDHMNRLHPILLDLSNENLKQKHADKLQAKVGKLAVLKDKELPFAKILDSSLIKFADAVHDICSQATEEARLENLMAEISARWTENEKLPLNMRENHSDVFVVGNVKPIKELLKKDQGTMKKMLESPCKEHVEASIETWTIFTQKAERLLSNFEMFQQFWDFLENLFSSANTRKEMPEEARLFTRLDRAWRDMMRKTIKDPIVSKIAANVEMTEKLEEMLTTASECSEKIKQIIAAKHS